MVKYGALMVFYIEYVEYLIVAAHGFRCECKWPTPVHVSDLFNIDSAIVTKRLTPDQIGLAWHVLERA